MATLAELNAHLHCSPMDCFAQHTPEVGECDAALTAHALDHADCSGPHACFAKGDSPCPEADEEYGFLKAQSINEPCCDGMTPECCDGAPF